LHYQRLTVEKARRLRQTLIPLLTPATRQWKISCVGWWICQRYEI